MDASTLNPMPVSLPRMSRPSERIQELMRDMDWGQSDVARASGASKSVVSQWLTDRIKSIDARYAFALQRATGISAEWVQLGTGPKRLPGTASEVEQSSAPTPSPEIREITMLFQLLTDEQQVRFLNDIRHTVESNRAIYQKFSTHSDVDERVREDSSNPGIRQYDALLPEMFRRGDPIKHGKKKKNGP